MVCPFPACDEAAKARIRALGEELDAHRKRVQAQHPGLSLTAMYNVLAALRAGRALTPKETATHDTGLVSVLRQLHDELDAAVATAYGWLRDGHPETDLPDAEILTRLVALNATRAAEEATGQIRYLRPEYQAPQGTRTQTGLAVTTQGAKPTKAKASKAKEPWPKPLAERVAAVERALAAPQAPSPQRTWRNTSSAPNPKTSPRSSKPWPRWAAHTGMGRDSPTNPPHRPWPADRKSPFLPARGKSR